MSKQQNLLFITKSDKLQVFDFKNENILKEYSINHKKNHFDIVSRFSPDKSYYYFYSKLQLIIIDAKTLEVVYQNDYEKLAQVRFIDNNQFYTVVKNNHLKISLFEIEQKEIKKLNDFISKYNKQSKQYLFKIEEKIFHQISENTIVCYDNKNYQKIQSLRLVEDFLIHDFKVHGNRLYLIMNNIFIKEKNKSIVKIYQFEQNYKLLVKRGFKNVQELQMSYNENFSQFIVKAMQYQDKTSNSYYGREKIFWLNKNINKFESISTYDGVIHDIKILKNGQFIAIQDTSPSRTILYDQKIKPFYQFCHGYKNQIYLTDDNKLMALAGFGGFNGSIEIWDPNQQKFYGHCKSPHSSILKWSTNNTHFFTAIIYKKLKTDHQIDIFTNLGENVKKIKINENNLINVDFVPEQKIEFNQKFKEIQHLVVPKGLRPVAPDKPGPITESKIKKSQKKTTKQPKVQVQKPNTKNIVLSRGANFKKK